MTTSHSWQLERSRRCSSGADRVGVPSLGGNWSRGWEGREKASLRLEEADKELTKLPSDDFSFLHGVGQRFTEAQWKEKILIEMVWIICVKEFWGNCQPSLTLWNSLPLCGLPRGPLSSSLERRSRGWLLPGWAIAVATRRGEMSEDICQRKRGINMVKGDQISPETASGPGLEKIYLCK